MSWVLFDEDPVTGRKRWMSLDEGPPGKTLWRIELPVDGLVDANAEAEKATQGVRFGDWNRVASVPLNILEKTQLDTAIQMGDDKYVSKVLNDSDNSKFRTSRGRV
ncbi:MAG TPA: hypothetical protein PLQ83_18440 [Thermoflexales bacterium]|nr:hypothetical protein [Thermoflexales bacterium]